MDCFAARRLTDIGVLPRAVVKIRHIPTGNFRICIIKLAAAEVVEKDWRSSAFEAFIRFKAYVFFAARGFKRKRQLGRRTENRFVKLPNEAADGVGKAVAEKKG